MTAFMIGTLYSVELESTSGQLTRFMVSTWPGHECNAAPSDGAALHSCIVFHQVLLIIREAVCDFVLHLLTTLLHTAYLSSQRGDL